MEVTCDDESKSIYEVNLTDIGLRDTFQSLNFSSLPNFRSLVLKNNSFYGVVPQHIGVMSNLDTLNLSLNGFFGRIPNNIGNLFKLSHLNLSFNNMNDSIPISIGKLDDNQLFGHIPRVIWSTSRDYILELIVFQTPFLEKLEYLKHLDELDLSNNHLSGTIPSTIGNLAIYIIFIFTGTSLVGAFLSIPFTQSNC
jgi:Leucine-rich repeat (LRR) protein